MSDDSFGSELQPAPATAEASNGTGMQDETSGAAGATGDSLEGSSPDFLGRLADAMRQTAEAERARVGEEIDRRRTEHLTAIQARRDSETARMRELAADDRRGIERWAEEERQRIQAERDQRLAAVEADLAESLGEHGRTVDAEVETVEARIAAHRTEVDAFFASLGTETDPVRIATLAGQRPTFPVFDTAPATSDDATAEVVTADATAPTESPAPEASSSDATSPDAAAPEAVGGESPEAPVVAVMDPIARLGLLRAGVQTEDPSGPRPTPAGAWRPTEIPGEAPQERPTAPVGASSGALNPIGWIRRKDDSGDR